MGRDLGPIARPCMNAFGPTRTCPVSASLHFPNAHQTGENPVADSDATASAVRTSVVSALVLRSSNARARPCPGLRAAGPNDRTPHPIPTHSSHRTPALSSSRLRRKPSARATPRSRPSPAPSHEDPHAERANPVPLTHISQTPPIVPCGGGELFKLAPLSLSVILHHVIILGKPDRLVIRKGGDLARRGGMVSNPAMMRMCCF